MDHGDDAPLRDQGAEHFPFAVVLNACTGVEQHDVAHADGHGEGGVIGEAETWAGSHNLSLAVALRTIPKGSRLWQNDATFCFFLKDHRCKDHSISQGAYRVCH